MENEVPNCGDKEQADLGSFNRSEAKCKLVRNPKISLPLTPYAKPLLKHVVSRPSGGTLQKGSG